MVDLTKSEKRKAQMKAAKIRWYAKHADQERVAARKRMATKRVADPSGSKAKAAAWYEANKEREKTRMIAWHAANKEKAAARKAACRKVDAAKARRAEQKRRKAKIEAYRAADRAWRKANPEKCRAIKMTRRAKEMGSNGRYDASVITWLMGQQKGKCAHPWCGESIEKHRHVDHVLPLAIGGTNDRRNLQLLCPTCNRSKGAKHPVDFALQHGMLV
jgi:5-methylcytosine-specific restriction endonuclease McrA